MGNSAPQTPLGIPRVSPCPFSVSHASRNSVPWSGMDLRCQQGALKSYLSKFGAFFDSPVSARAGCAPCLGLGVPALCPSGSHHVPKAPCQHQVSPCHLLSTPWGHGCAWLAAQQGTCAIPGCSPACHSSGETTAFLGVTSLGWHRRCCDTVPHATSSRSSWGGSTGTPGPRFGDRSPSGGQGGGRGRRPPAPAAAAPAEPRTRQLISRQVLLMDHLLFLVSRAINLCHLTAAS